MESMFRSFVYMNVDAETMRLAGAMIRSHAVFMTFYTQAMRASVSKVQKLAQENAPVKNGTLRRGIRGHVVTPYTGQIGVINAVPYGRRREYGFDGQTDRLGRHYTMDPLPGTISSDGLPARSHMMYLHRAVKSAEPFILAAYREATQLAIRDLLFQ